MRILERKEDYEYSKGFMLDARVNYQNLYELISLFETSEVKMTECKCAINGDDGFTKYAVYHNIEDVKKMPDDDYLMFDVDFCKNSNGEYQYTVLAYDNSNEVTCSINLAKRGIAQNKPGYELVHGYTNVYYANNSSPKNGKKK